MTTSRTITQKTARQLAVTRQHLDNGHPPPGMLDLIHDLGCLQLDPVSAVARSHQLVLWSRLGQYELADLDHLLWRDRTLFEYWAHVASIVPTRDFPIHAYRMKHYPDGDSPWAKRVRDWWATPGIAKIHDILLEQFRAIGPLPSRAFEHLGADFPPGMGWTNNSNVPRMIDYLWQRGEIMVSYRQGIQRFWDIAERCLPDAVPQEDLSADEVTRRAAQTAIRALGVATPAQIREHYTRGRYYDLERILDELESQQVIQRIQIDGLPWNGRTYLHTQDLPLLDHIESGGFVPRTTLLSPFDNLICDRKRTEQLFDFFFRIEIYVPPNKRQYGYYVLPILHGDALIGRIDPKLDRKTGTLHINAVHAEENAPDDPETVSSIRQAINSLAQFVKAEKIVFGGSVPTQWRNLQNS